MTDASSLPKPPKLGPTEENPEEWVTFLQQTLNWFYQMQVVPQNGSFDHTTRNAVEHLRGQLGLSAEPVVDDRVWQELGVNDTAVEEVDRPVELIGGNEDTSWAAAIAMVLRSKGEARTIEEVLAKADPQRRRSATEARQIATDHFAMTTHACHAVDGGSWTGVLKAHGALWVPVPGDEQHVIVVAGIRPEGDTVKIHVADPHTGNDEWLEFEAFHQSYAITEQTEIEVMAAN